MRACVVLLAAGAAFAARSPGCAQYGCDSALSFAVSGVLPSTSAVAVSQLYALGGSGSLANSSSYSGCISNGLNRVVCSGSPFWINSDEWSGFVIIDPTTTETSNGSVVLKYSGDGSGHCTEPISLYGAFSNYNLPLFDSTGSHIWTWDTNNAACLSSNGAVAWTEPIFPSASCPGFLSQVTATNTSLLPFGIGPLGEAFTLHTNGLPDASLQLNFSWSVGAGGAPLQGFLSPVAPLGVIGSRVLYLTRFYVVDPTDDGDGGYAPSNMLFVAALDTLQGAMPRIRWTWTYQLPTDGTVFEDGAQCQPVQRQSDPEQPLGPSNFLESIAITGPSTFPAWGGAVIALSCQGQALVMGISVNGSAQASLVWRQQITLPGGSEDYITGQAIQPALSGSGNGNGNASSIWLLAKESGALYLLDAATGTMATPSSTGLTPYSSLDALMATASSGLQAQSDCFAASPSSSLHFSGAPGWLFLGALNSSAVSGGGGDYGDNGSGNVLVVGVRITDAGNVTSFAAAAFAVLPPPPPAIGGSPVLTPLWCALTPTVDGSSAGTYPLVGQPAAVLQSSSGGAETPSVVLTTAQGAVYLLA